jgi:hypothetical protein
MPQQRTVAAGTADRCASLWIACRSGFLPPFDAFLLKMSIELLYITKTSGKGLSTQ